ncbi:(2,3-dihydroxybenzoyl)adenylate synthase [Lentzea flava]|uniref:2,3-dihydroxybenzoate-AMP ligase n=1 Tax=Lentzea flava TaxID=103732 RepID=A0ABQ2UGA2_9PSEU|nr:(2,3-dihydroxybenzoyl)adenylate synthase [Lentzea flava]MCP2198988.1 2,3-dihydroxybenzoate-AMP ligase [Lentzea flava]GGU32440.1 2,3-dihydroxybenzoate-AMP ligase [Lentzea flava]
MLQGCVPWPDQDAARFTDAGYWRGETLGALLRDWAARHGDRTALVCGDRRISYQRLDAWADRLAAGLRAQGIRSGDRIVVQLPNVAEFVALCFAMFRLGALPVFALPAYRANEIRHLCELSGAIGIVVPREHADYDYVALAKEIAGVVPAIEHVFVADSLPEADPVALPEPDPRDVAFFLLSGGTTALPKLIPRTHDDYAYQTRITAEINELGPDSVYLTVLPIEFNFPWGCPGIIGVFQAGGTAVMALTPEPEPCFELIERERVTITSVVPTITHLWLEAVPHSNRDMSSLEIIQIGSAKLHPEVAARVQPAFGCRLQQVFGMAEGLLTFTRADDPEDVVLTTQGRPVSPADEIRVVDESGNDVPVGVAGELLTRGPYTLRGYYNAPEHNAKAFTSDGFYRSGDLVRFTESGHMVVEGRVKDVINRGGDKISATEVEAHLTAHPNVAQAAVVAVPDLVLGEKTCAVIIPDGAAPKLPQLRKLLRERGLADYKLPDRVEVVESFPLTGLGKVDKKSLAATIAGGSGGR